MRNVASRSIKIEPEQINESAEILAIIFFFFWKVTGSFDIHLYKAQKPDSVNKQKRESEKAIRLLCNFVNVDSNFIKDKCQIWMLSFDGSGDCQCTQPVKHGKYKIGFLI